MRRGRLLFPLLSATAGCLLLVDHEAPFHYTAVATNGEAVCAVRSTGTWACWGFDAIPPEGNFEALAGGNYSFCGLRPSGEIECITSLSDYGLDESPSGTFYKLDVNDDSSLQPHGCALALNGSATCWGGNEGGVSEPPDATFIDIAVNGDLSCGLLESGSIRCWGESSWDDPPSGTFTRIDLGNNFGCALRSNGVPACWGYSYVHVEDLKLPEGPFQKVAVGYDHACGLREDGTIACWGENDYYQASAPSGTFLDVTASDRTTCAITGDNGIRCWGVLEVTHDPVP